MIMIQEKILKYFQQDIALAVISGLKKGAECEFSKVTVRPFTSGEEIKYQFEYTVKAQGDFGLANVAATTVNLLGYEAPDMWNESLIETK